MSSDDDSPKPLWHMSIDRYDDYTVQVTADAEDKIRWQILGVEKTGRKDILKELDSIPFQSRFDGPNTTQHKEYHAEDKPSSGSNLVTQSGIPFVVGLAVGGFAVYLFMQGKIREYEQKLNDQAATIGQLSNQLMMYTQPYQEQSQQAYNAGAPSELNFGDMHDYTPFGDAYPG